jgi:hypothetical protein
MDSMRPNILRSLIQITEQPSAQQFYPAQQYYPTHHQDRFFNPQASCLQNSNTVSVPSIQDVPRSAVEPPVVVNAKQYHRILVRREFRQQNPITRRLYIHQSRSIHATRRPRGAHGHFLSTEEAAARRCGGTTTSTKDEGRSDYGGDTDRCSTDELEETVKTIIERDKLSIARGWDHKGESRERPKPIVTRDGRLTHTPLDTVIMDFHPPDNDDFIRDPTPQQPALVQASRMEFPPEEAEDAEDDFVANITTLYADVQKDKHGSQRQMPPVTQSMAFRNFLSDPRRCERINPRTGTSCNSTFSRLHELNRHNGSVHRTGPPIARCELCTDITFTRYDALTRHMRVGHPDVNQRGETKKKKATYAGISKHNQAKAAVK